ncbi:UNVERIFIED_CONTAM: hypothetical protein K2H54_054629 [Gekko kuhli]
MAQLPPGIYLITSFTRDQWYRAFIFVLTFMLYVSFHLSRKPISIVKGELHKHCAIPQDTELVNYKKYAVPSQPMEEPCNKSSSGWEPFVLIDKVAPIFTNCLSQNLEEPPPPQGASTQYRGIIGERLPIRYYLTGGMFASGFFTAMFGLGYFYNIHNLWFYIAAQIVNGLVQTTGWPSVVTCIGNWFGKGRRGLIMGLWNSHTSVGNILGSLIAGYWVSTCWGLSFVVPGIIISVMGIVCYLFLIEHPKDINCASTSTNNSKSYMNGSNRFKIQKQKLSTKETSKSQDPEMQCLLSDNENCVKPLNCNNGFCESYENGHSAISFIGALRIPGVIEFSLCLLFAKLVSYTFIFWLPLYITNVDNLNAKEAGDLSTLFDVGGIFGGILAGIISDRLKKRASTCGIMLLIAAPVLYVFSAVSKMGLEATIVMLLICGALVNGPYALITTAVSADLEVRDIQQ